MQGGEEKLAFPLLAVLNRCLCGDSLLQGVMDAQRYDASPLLSPYPQFAAYNVALTQLDHVADAEAAKQKRKDDSSELWIAFRVRQHRRNLVLAEWHCLARN